MAFPYQGRSDPLRADGNPLADKRAATVQGPYRARQWSPLPVVFTGQLYDRCRISGSVESVTRVTVHTPIAVLADSYASCDFRDGRIRNGGECRGCLRSGQL